jgi:hypothetical protein
VENESDDDDDEDDEDDDESDDEGSDIEEEEEEDLIENGDANEDLRLAVEKALGDAAAKEDEEVKRRSLNKMI